MHIEVSSRRAAEGAIALWCVLASACSEEATSGAAGSGVAGAPGAAAAPAAGTPPQVAGAPGTAAAPAAGIAPGVAGTNAAGAAVPEAGSAAGAMPPAGGTGADGGGAPGAGDSSGGAPGVEPELPTADWRMMGYDLGSTFLNRGETTLSTATAATLEVAWTADLGGNVYGAALQVGDAIYASGPSRVYAFDAASGAERWSVALSSSSSLAFEDGTLYAHSNGANIVALDAADGTTLWTEPSNPASRGDGSSSPLVAGDVVLVGGSNGTVELVGGTFRGFMSALDRTTGAVAWTEYTVPTGAKGASIWSSPAADLVEGRVFGTTGNNYGAPATDTSDAFVAFDLHTGAIVWKNQRVANDTFGGGIGQRNGPDADFGANPVLYETMLDGVLTKLLGAANKGGAAHAVRADTGALVWTRDLCAGSTNGLRGVFTNSAWTGTDLLVACNEESSATLFALDGATGDVRWMRALPGLVWGRTAVANGVGVVGTGESVEIFDAATGALIKAFPSGGGTVASTITIARGRIAFGDGLTWQSGVRGSTLTVLSVAE